MEHEVFISYSSKGRHIADIVCNVLELNKIKCWVAPRDIVPGKTYASSIVDAIAEAKVFLLILSQNSNTSEHVLSEVERAFSRNINLITYKVEDVTLRKELQYFLSSKHWLDSLSEEVREQLRNLVKALRVYLKKNMNARIIIPEGIRYVLKVSGPTDSEPERQSPAPPPTAPPLPEKKKLPLWTTLSVCVLAAAALFFFAVIPLIGNGKTTLTDVSSGLAQGSPAVTDGVFATSSTATQGTSAPEETAMEAGATAAADADAIAFQTIGEARIKVKDGQEIVCPANCVLFRRTDLTAGLPDPQDKSSASVTPFENIRSFTVEAQTNADGGTEHVFRITKRDGSTLVYTYAYEAGVLLFTNGDNRGELSLSGITQVDFDFDKDIDTKVKLALVTPVSGNPFYAPADLISIRILSLGLGVSTSWSDSLPMDGGNTIPFSMLSAFEILESKETGLNGWYDEAKVDIVMKEGDHIKGGIKADSMFFTGINRLGTFSLDLTNGLKRIDFNPGSPIAPANDNKTAEDVLAFQPIGEAEIRTKDGQEYICPANCVLFKRFAYLYDGLPYTALKLEKVIPFKEITTLTVGTKPDNLTYVVTVVKQDGKASTVEYFFDAGFGALLFQDDGGAAEVELNKVAEVTFNFSKACSAAIKHAVVTPSSGNPFQTPADLLSVFIHVYTGNSFKWSWRTELPLERGKTIPFKQIHSVQIGEARKHEVNEFNDEVAVDIELKTGEHIQGVMKAYECRFSGLNRIGAFNLNILDELKSITFIE